MSEPRTFRGHVTEAARLATPLAAAQLGQILLGVVDTAVVGRVGELELGAVGLGNAIFYTFAIFGIGLMLGVEPLVAQAIGAGEHDEARGAMWQGVWLALATSLPLVALTSLAATQVHRAGVAPDVAAEASRYVHARLPGLPAVLLFNVARSYLQARAITRPMMVGAIAANVLNLPLSWWLVLGDDGLQRLGLAPIGLAGFGVVGAGAASVLASVVQLGIAARAVRVATADEGPVARGVRRDVLRKGVKLGFPLGIQRLAEVGLFSVTGVLMGRLGSEALAAHQIAMTIATTTFMVPLGISSAASVLVGRAVGRGDARATRQAGLASITLGCAFMALAGVALWLAPGPIAGVLTDQDRLIGAARPLILIAAAFQLFDGVQVVAAGALRGAGDTRIPMWLAVGGHYLVGLGAGATLAFVFDRGAIGLYWGLFAGLSSVAIALLWRFVRISARTVARA